MGQRHGGVKCSDETVPRGRAGPDGFVWTYLKDVLVRIDPKDVSVHVVGRIVPVGYPTFVGKDVYLSGSEQLRRIRGIGQGNIP